MSNTETRKTSISCVSSVFRTCAKHFAELGFTNRTPGIFTLDLAPNTLGWVGLNKAIRGGELRIYPIVGVRYQRLEAIISTLHGIPDRSFIPPSVSSPLGYVMPQNTFVQWKFPEELNNEEIVAEMVATIHRYGRPFMVRHVDVENLEETFEIIGRLHPEQEDYRIIVALALTGKQERANRFIEAKLQNLLGRTDPAADHFRKFVENFRSYNFSLVGED